MTRYDLVRMLVLTEISDDYEEPAHVYENVSARARDCGIQVDRSEVNRALIELVKIGWAKPYDLWKTPPVELQVAPQIEEVGEYYYWITPEGLQAHPSFEGWPFDDEGMILPGWRPPPQ